MPGRRACSLSAGVGVTTTCRYYIQCDGDDNPRRGKAQSIVMMVMSGDPKSENRGSMAPATLRACYLAFLLYTRAHYFLYTLHEKRLYMHMYASSCARSMLIINHALPCAFCAAPFTFLAKTAACWQQNCNRHAFTRMPAFHAAVAKEKAQAKKTACTSPW